MPAQARQRFKGTDRNYRLAGAHRQALGNPAGEPQTGEGARAGTKGNRIHVAKCKARILEELDNFRKDGFRMAGTTGNGTFVHPLAVQEGDRGGFGGGFEG